MKAIAIILIVFALNLNAQQAGNIADSTASNVQLHTFLEKENVPLNREVVYHVELSWEGELHRYHIIKTGEPVLTNLKLRGSGSSNRFFIDKKGTPHSVKTITYYFIPQSMGMAYIDGVIIKYEDTINNDKESLMSQRLGVKIGEPLAEPGKGMNVGQIIVILAVILFLLILFYFLWRYFSMRKRQKNAQQEISLSLEETYQKLLTDDVKEADGEASEKFAALSKLLKNYFAEKFNLATVATFSEIDEFLSDEKIGAGLHDKLKALYDRSELSKFAGEKISENEFHLFYDTVELLLKQMNAGNEQDNKTLEVK